MVGITQLDFLNYSTALKGNYTKGADRLRTMLQSPTQGNAFASNLGGVTVIFGVDPDYPDGNSDALLSILQASPYADQAAATWLKDFYNPQTQDDLFGDVKRCKEIEENPLIMQAVRISGSMLGKWTATTIGQDCRTYDNITEVITKNQTALENETVMKHIIGNGEALSTMLKDANLREKLGKWGNESRQGNYRTIKMAIMDKARFKKSAWFYCTNQDLTYNGTNFMTVSIGYGEPLPCLFMCHKVGGTGNYSIPNAGKILSIQSGTEVANLTINNTNELIGGQEDTSTDIRGRKEERFCIGGVRVRTTAGGIYAAGYFYYAL